MQKFLLILLILASNYSFSQIDSGLVMFAPFDGNFVNSVSGPANTFTIEPEFVADRFNTGSCAVYISESNNLNTNYKISSKNKFTFSFFLKVDKPDQHGVILGRIPALEIKNDNLQFTDWFSSKNIINHKIELTKWHHVAFTYDSVNTTAYVNGKLTGSFKLANFFEAFHYIGNNHELYIDDLRIYNRVLPFDEILKLKNLPLTCTITNNIERTLETSSLERLKFFTLTGKEIRDIGSHQGAAILLYSDGSTKKIMAGW